jgi:ketosteroid isomerase-like protein
MANLTGPLLGMALMLGAATLTAAQSEQNDDRKEHNMEVPMMSTREKNVEVILEIFSAIERRDEQRVLALFHPDAEFHWPPSLSGKGGPTWEETWFPLQPTEAERGMDPRVVAASDETGEVVVLWRQRGVSAAGDRFDGEVLGLYQLREGKLARAQMFYFDTAAVASFLAKAITPEQRALFDRFNSLPDEPRGLVRRAYGDLLMMPPSQRQQMLNTDRFKSMLSGEERELLHKLLK